jgi:serralysin
VALQGDGKIVAVGYGEDFGIARYNPNGSLDTSFSGDGKQATDFAPFGVALQGNGKIVPVGAGVGPSQTNDFALARYLGG